MPKILSLRDQVLFNYEEFLNNPSQTEPLSKNFELFESLTNKKIRIKLNKADVDTLGKCNEVVLTLALSHMEFAFAKQNQGMQKSVLRHLNVAKNYFGLVNNAISHVPASNMTDTLGNQLIEVGFYQKKIEFQKAQLELSFIRNLIKGKHGDLKLTQSKLEKVIKAYSIFENIVSGQYKDVTLRAQFAITNEFIDSISAGILKAEQLLNELGQKNKPVSVELPTVEDSNPMPINIDMGDDEENESESAPITKMIQSVTYSPTFWAPIPVKNPLEDSDKMIDLLNQWSHRYLAKNQVEQKLVQSVVLEKFAHTLILAAMKLQNEHGDFQSQKSNPCIRLAIQLLLRAAESGSNSPREAFKRLAKLSSQYSEILEPFMNTGSSSVSPKQYIKHLHKQAHHDAQISILGLKIEETVAKVFEFLNSQCKMDDYTKIIQTCHSSIERSLVRLNAEETTNNCIRI